jgi:hypothetical protein
MAKNVSKINKAEIQSVAKKLDVFSKQLPAKERALFNLLLARADQRTKLNVTEFVPKSGVFQTVSAALASLLAGRGIGASGWVQGGDPWVQSGLSRGGWVQGGDPWVQSGGIADPFGNPAPIDYMSVATEASELGKFLNPAAALAKSSRARSKKSRSSKRS